MAIAPSPPRGFARGLRVSFSFACLTIVAAACQRPTTGSGPTSSSPATSPGPAPSVAPATVSTPSGASAAVSAVPSGAPLSRLVPTARPGPRALCPLTIEPGVSFGPVALGETIDDLIKAGLSPKNVSDYHADIEIGAKQGGPGTLRVSLCAGKIIDIWIDDLRLAPACVSYQGKVIDRDVAREALEKTFGGCEATEPRIGGSFERCHGGGLYVGHGMGNFMQLRVRPKAFPFDDACGFATDDGSLVELTPAERSTLLKKTLNLSELSKFWHVDKPGRDPLRIVRTSLVAEQSLTMFGSPVSWIDEKDAKKGSAYFTVTKLEATKTKGIVAFTYPIEGVAGTATFKRIVGTPEWRLEKADVHER